LSPGGKPIKNHFAAKKCRVTRGKGNNRLKSKVCRREKNGKQLMGLRNLRCDIFRGGERHKTRKRKEVCGCSAGRCPTGKKRGNSFRKLPGGGGVLTKTHHLWKKGTLDQTRKIGWRGMDCQGVTNMTVPIVWGKVRKERISMTKKSH